MEKQKKHLNNFGGFTLVELIIVITILAILATIAFSSYKNYAGLSRDGNRLATINSIQKGLDLYQIQVGNLPFPDNQTGTGIFGSGGEVLNYVGKIGQNVSNQIKINKIPLDPLANTQYAYGISADSKKYQVAVVLENLQGSNIAIESAYADDGYKAKVLGNYNGLLSYKDKLYNIPSLIVTSSGIADINLIGTGVNYVVNNQPNLPYAVGDSVILNTLPPNEVLKKVTNSTGSLTITGVALPKTITDLNNSSGSLAALGYSLDVIGSTTLGNAYKSIPSSPVSTASLSFVSQGNGIEKTSDGKLIKIKGNGGNPGSSLTYDLMTYNPNLLTSGDGWTYGAGDVRREWGCNGVSISTTPTGAQQNTTNIVNGNCKTGAGNNGSGGDAYIAANFCDNLSLTVNGVTLNDWYLPSGVGNNNIYELQVLYNNKANIGGFNETGVYYWSSTQIDGATSRILGFNSLIWINYTGKINQHYLRCVRVAI